MVGDSGATTEPDVRTAPDRLQCFVDRDTRQCKMEVVQQPSGCRRADSSARGVARRDPVFSPCIIRSRSSFRAFQAQSGVDSLDTRNRQTYNTSAMKKEEECA